MSPWTRQQHGLLIAVNGAAAVLLVWATRMSAGTGELSAQVPWVTLAVVALAVACGGDVLWLLAGRRGLLAHRRRLIVARARPVETTVGPATIDTNAVWLHVPGTSRVHRQGCLLATGRGTQAIEDPDHWRRCEICTP